MQIMKEKCMLKRVVFALLAILSVYPMSNVSAASKQLVNPQVIESFNRVASKVLKDSDTPGVSVAIVDGTDTYMLNYGYSDQTSKEKVTENTLFETASLSKAFTALGILYLEQEGKLQLSDNIADYIPGVSFYYEEGNGKKEANITIENALYHTTGIPFQTMGYLPEGDTDDMLEKTVSMLNHQKLNFCPGSSYLYNSIDYDILGRIIEIVTGKTYEEFMQEQIFKPLGLLHTYVRREEAETTGMLSKGYKTEFFKARSYEAPVYRGNNPAGYIISSAKDMQRWMQIQMGTVEIPKEYKTIIEKSHIPDYTVATAKHGSYAAGWNVNLNSKILSHGGNNPNYSSLLFMDREQKVSICILSNLNGNVAEYLASCFFYLIHEQKGDDFKPGIYQSLDRVFSVLMLATVILSVVYFIALCIVIYEIIIKKRRRERLKRGKVAAMLLALPIIVFYGFCIYYLPNIILERLPWSAVKVWGSRSIVYGSIGAFLCGVLFFLYVVITFNYPKRKEKNYITLIPLSVINGLASALIIFTINETFNRNLDYSKELVVYFIFALTFFLYTRKLLQGRLIVITNEIVYEKRTGMIDKIIKSTYQNIERIGFERIYSGLNNDISEISKIPNTIVTFFSNVLTIVFCMIYLCSKSVPAFIVSSVVILGNAIISVITGRAASIYWEKNRDIQDVYYGQMSDLVYGYKELLLSRDRKRAFWQDIIHYSRLSTELMKEASIKFLNFNLYSTFMYNSIFGIVVFIFPLLIGKVNVNDLRQLLFIVFYLVGPFGIIMNSIPSITQIRVNLKRINTLTKDLEQNAEIAPQSVLPENKKYTKIQLKQVQFHYTENQTGSNPGEIEFTLGPIDMEVGTGEIVYITGGNGSGKSTLGKIMTGLYQIQEGMILVDGKASSIFDLNQCFSAVYSDYYLFDKLYGLDLQKKRETLQTLLKCMKLEDKIKVDEEGKLNTTNLSTGQKKRLAYSMCCLDDKPFMLFDEWAAEQDPEFRHYFYHELLVRLKEQGKGVIVISHDDRYFHLADKLYKLERGVIVTQ